MAEKGVIEILIYKSRDICNTLYLDCLWMPPLPHLQKQVQNASMEDVAAGIIHMVLQSMGQSVIIAWH